MPVDNGKGPDKDKVQIIAEHVDFADPYILSHEGTYYAYGTSSDSGFEAFSSKDLLHWKRHPRLILDKKDSYGERWFWAPEVFYNPTDEMFYLFYSAQEHICVATSDSPLGPFVQTAQEPMRAERSIDSTLFIDDDGTAYIFFVRFVGGNVIWCAELEDDWMTIREETLAQCVAVSEKWEMRQAKVAEGPSVIKKDGVYYMLYSANDYQSRDYGVGFARADSPVGPWVKSRSNPILQKPANGLLGTGHGAYLTDSDGKYKYVFHAHFGHNSVHPRQMYILDMEIGEGSISMDHDSIITPVEIK
jgi:beta-xylosidase